MDASRKNLFQKLARAGFAARGITYCLIGGLAFAAAIGSGGGTTGSRGALATLADSGWGTAVLFLIGIGLFGYGLWRLTAAGLDLENQGHGKEGATKRVAHVAAGLVYFSLSIYAIALAFGATTGGGGESGADSMTAKLMSAPFGIFLVGLAGAIGIGVALAQVKKAVKEEYRAHTHIPEHGGWVNRTIKAGILSRAVVFAIIGGFLIYAAITANPDQAVGMGGALDWLRGRTYGAVLLGLIGAGLFAFGLFSLIQARYHRIPDPEPEARSKLRQASA
jgi:hypothetical protein